ncbi:hypothetical protein D3C81_2146870 [compost metagenome]
MQLLDGLQTFAVQTRQELPHIGEIGFLGIWGKSGILHPDQKSLQLFFIVRL